MHHAGDVLTDRPTGRPASWFFAGAHQSAQLPRSRTLCPFETLLLTVIYSMRRRSLDELFHKNELLKSILNLHITAIIFICGRTLDARCCCLGADIVAHVQGNSAICIIIIKSKYLPFAHYYDVSNSSISLIRQVFINSCIENYKQLHL